jgi:hypothetical protein
MFLCRIRNRAAKAGWLVVNSAALVSINSHGTVSLAISNSGSVGAVNGDLIVVGT